MEEYAKNFEDAVREYLSGSRDWDSVHELAVQMEWDDQVEFPREIRRPMEELQMIFLADSRDDPQFRADKNEISELLAQIDQLKRAANELGVGAVIKRERALEEERERSLRQKFVEKRKKRRCR